jgi:hypothetical protein
MFKCRVCSRYYNGIGLNFGIKYFKIKL